MKVLVLVISILLIDFIPANSQIKFNVTGVYPQYEISRVKEQLADKADRLDFPAKVTDNFPLIPTLSYEVSYMHHKFEVGLVYTKITTGGRVHYQDFSGEYTSDHLIDFTTYGVVVKVPFYQYKYKDKGLVYELIMETGDMELDHVINEAFNFIDEEKEESNFNAYSSYFYFKLGLATEYRFYNFMVGPELSYVFTGSESFVGKLDGFRAGLRLNYILTF